MAASNSFIYFIQLQLQKQQLKLKLTKSIPPYNNNSDNMQNIWKCIVIMNHK